MNYKYKLSLCVVIKNEVEYINDFLEHYVNQGIEHFYIINNNSTDGVENFIENHKYIDKITLIKDDTDFKYNQLDCPHKDILDRNLYSLLKETTEWAIIIDIDEFMYGKNGFTISTYIDSLEQEINNVYVYWNIIIPAKEENTNEILETFSPKKSTKRINLDFLDKLPWEIQWACKFGKSLFRTSALNDYNKLWIHKVHVDGKIITNYNTLSENEYDNADNEIIFSEENFNKTNISLKHYAIRNKKDYLRRLDYFNNYFNNPSCETKTRWSKALVDICYINDQFLTEKI